MSILSRYLIGQFFRIWLLALVGFIVLYTTVDFLEKVGDFTNQNIPFSTMLLFFAAQLPKIFVLMVPVSTLVSVIISLALLARNSEIVAFKAAGVSLYRLGAPLLMTAFLLCLATFLISDILAPRASAVANSIWLGQVRERIDTSSVVQDLWIRNVRLIQHLGSFDTSNGRAADISLYFFDENLHLVRRLEAVSGQMADNELRLADVMEKTYPPAKKGRGREPVFVLTRHDRYVIPDWPAPPPGFGRLAVQAAEEMSAAELWRTIDRLQAEGFGSLRQRVDLQFKFSFAFLSLIMVVVGLPIGFWKEKGGSVALGLAVGLVFSFIYLISLELSKTLGYSGLLPPIVAAWLPNVLFFLFGSYLFSYIRQ